MDEHTLREIYLTGIENAIKGAQPWTVMYTYNLINGTYASDHYYLMNGILKGEWGYQGLVVTDWGAMNERVEALKVGVDLEMPGPSANNDAKLVAAVRFGKLDLAVLDRAVERILSLISKAETSLEQDFSYDRQVHLTLARRVASEGAVLPKNNRNLLPLKANARIALIGRFAKESRYQGAGSSTIIPTRLDNLYSELTKLVGEAHLTYGQGYTENGDVADEGLIQEVLDVAREADVVVVCAGLTDMDAIESIDRKDMSLTTGHNALFQRLCATNKNVVVVLSNGVPVDMPWIQDVPAVLEVYLGGQAGAGVIADILTGKVNPSGKLAASFPLLTLDSPAQPFPGGQVTVEYPESIYIGYRYYDTARWMCFFPFVTEWAPPRYPYLWVSKTSRLPY